MASAGRLPAAGGQAWSTNRSASGSVPGWYAYRSKSVTPSAASTSSHRNAFPVQSRLGLVITAYAASEYSSGRRARAIAASPPSRFCTAAVAISVRGHSALDAMPSSANSAANPSAHMVIPYLAMVYPMCGPSHRGSRLTGGDRVRMCGFADRFRCGMQARLTTNVPRVLIDCIRSYRLTSSASVPDRLIAEALLTHTSIPPNRSTANATAPCTWASSRMSPTTGSALPPAASICSAAVYTVPSSFGCGSAVLAISATLAPSRAARSAIARPMPRLPPEMNNVLPASVIDGFLPGDPAHAAPRPVRLICSFSERTRGLTSASAWLWLLGLPQAAQGSVYLGFGG